jgi:flagellar protein FlaI
MPAHSWLWRFSESNQIQTGPLPTQTPPVADSPVVVQGNIVDSYRIPPEGDPDSSAEVLIVDNDSFGRYVVKLPPLDERLKRALNLLKDNLRNAIPVEVSGSPEQVLRKYLWETAGKAGLLEEVENSHRKFLYYLLKDFAGFWEIDPLINDDELEEISLTRFDQPVRVLHRRFSEYMFMETNIVYESEERLQAFIRRLAQFGGASVSLANPSLKVLLHGASDMRVQATLGDEISIPGSSFDIRKQRGKMLTMVQLAALEPARPYPSKSPVPLEVGSALQYSETPYHKTLTALMGAYFWLLLEQPTNVLIAGLPGSGKTTLMNAILAMMNPKAKIVTVEDSPEINLPSGLHWQRLKTRGSRTDTSLAGGRYEWTLPDLLKISLRFMPTILSVGEIRGEESETLEAAMTLGFSTITTVHAEDAARCIQRVTTPPMSFKEGHVQDITAIATMRRIPLPDLRWVRRVVSVDEIRPLGGTSHDIINIFHYDPATDSFSPSTPEEVLERSFRLKELAKDFGWTPENVLASLTNRAAYIAKAVENREFSADDLSRMVRTYVAKEFPKELIRGRAGIRGDIKT